ncbi:MAG: ATP-binding cassette domain-containing protein [Pseudomonadota bacterium]|nr:ATP-binding cassette domain-containing protein [Pseudomonadota bacterium]MEE3072494.1 ATP-binding cassette domain-containing protein [Pseudomonadota bacterium]
MNQPLVSLQDRSLGWGGQMVLTGVSVSVHAGDRIALLGRSGAGKSTLLSALQTELDRAALRVAHIPQDYGQVLELSAFHNVWMGRLDDFSTFANLRTLIWPSAGQRAEVRDVLNSVGLEGLDRKPVQDLSGGQRQRVALARALLRGGHVVLGDEPVSAVDPAQGADLLDALAQRFDTGVLALHDVDHALRFATRIIGLKDGRIALDAAAADVSRAEIMDLYA